MAIPAQTENNVNAVMKYLTQYLELRMDHAKRFNPKIRECESDLKWHQLDNMRAALRRAKPVGEVRIHVADILVSFDIEKRRQLFVAKGQLAIMSDVITSLADDLTKGSGVAIKDICTLYQAIDPFLRQVVDLMQMWLWWDLPDAADYALFDFQVERFKNLLRLQSFDSVQAHYRAETKSDKGGELSRQQILDFEFARMEGIMQNLEKRRLEEGNYQQILVREPSAAAKNDPADGLIQQIAQHLRAVEMIAASGQVEASLKDYYARALQCKPDEIKPEKAVEFERAWIAKTKQDLASALQSSNGDGAWYNFKNRQFLDTRRMFEAIRNEVKPQAAVAAE